MRPARRPLNRKRENANAAQAEMNIEIAAASEAMTRLLTNQRGNDPSNSFW